LIETPPRSAIGQRAREHRDRPRHEHENYDYEHAAPQVTVHQAEIDLAAEQDENKQPHDECGRLHILIESLRLGSDHFESERILIAEHDAENEYRHESA